MTGVNAHIVEERDHASEKFDTPCENTVGQHLDGRLMAMDSVADICIDVLGRFPGQRKKDIKGKSEVWIVKLKQFLGWITKKVYILR